MKKARSRPTSVCDASQIFGSRHRRISLTLLLRNYWFRGEERVYALQVYFPPIMFRGIMKVEIMEATNENAAASNIHLGIR